jgi:hypothetical protein
MATGFKHLIKCRCVLSQFKKVKNPPVHQFIVYSEVDDSDNVVIKFAQCNNCGLIHKVIDLCKSDIIEKKEDHPALLTIDDIKVNLNQNISTILVKNGCDLPTWEMVQSIIDNKRWGEFVVLSSETESGSRQGKILQILGESLFRVTPFSREEMIKGE